MSSPATLLLIGLYSKGVGFIELLLEIDHSPVGQSAYLCLMAWVHTTAGMCVLKKSVFFFLLVCF